MHAAQSAGVKRFVYTASNSVVMGGQRISGGDETLPYTERFNDLYTETKVVAEKFVLVAERRRWRHAHLLDPAQRHLGPRRPDDVPQGVRERARRTRQGAGRQQGRQARQLLRAQPDSRVHPRRASTWCRVAQRPGRRTSSTTASRSTCSSSPGPWSRHAGSRWPKLRVPGRLVWFVMTVWQWLHFRFGLPKPLLEPLAVERLYLDNYFSIAKARARSRLPAAVHHRAGDGAVPALLRRPVSPDEGRIGRADPACLAVPAPPEG